MLYGVTTNGIELHLFGVPVSHFCKIICVFVMPFSSYCLYFTPSSVSHCLLYSDVYFTAFLNVSLHYSLKHHTVVESHINSEGIQMKCLESLDQSVGCTPLTVLSLISLRIIVTCSCMSVF
jgi:hypothetical protein